MKRIFLAALGWHTLALGVAFAVPARPLYEPPDAPKQPAFIENLTGTAWITVYRNQTIIFLFEENGILSYNYNGARWANRGTWKHDRNQTSFEWLRRVEFRGTVKDQDTIAGEIVETTGKRESITLRKTAWPAK